MLVFNIETDVEKINEKLGPVMTKQIPYAIALALNRTVQSAHENVKKEMIRAFKTPVPYTLNSMYREYATRKKQMAALLFKSGNSKMVPADKYLQYEIYGGGRSHKSTEIAIEEKARKGSLYGVTGAAFLGGGKTNARLDSFGNIPRRIFDEIREGINKKEVREYYHTKTGRLKRAKRNGIFIIPIGSNSDLPAGVYRRKNNDLSQLLSLQPRKPQYKTIFKFNQVTYDKAEKLFSKHFAYALAQALSGKLSESILIE